MSLLMDALKRAENARQEHSDQPDPADPSRAPGSGTGPAGPEDESGTSRREGYTLSHSTLDALGAADDDLFDLQPEHGLEHSIEPTEAMESTGSTEVPVTPDSPPSVFPDLDPNAASFDDPAATRSSVQGAQAPMAEDFDGTRSVAVSRAAVRAAKHRDEPVGGEPSGAGQQRAVRDAFEAKLPPSKDTNWTAVVLVPFVLLLLVAIGGWVLWDPLVEVLVGRPSLATGQPRAPAIAAAAVAPALTPSTVSPAGAAQTSRTQPPAGTVTPVASEPSADASRGTTDAIEPGQSSVPVAGALSAVPTVSAVAQPMPEPEMTARPPPPGEVQPARLAGVAVDPAAVRTTPASRAPGIKIARRTSVPTVNPLLDRGYDALRSGDLDASAAAYEALLRREPSSRDARLGLAAIAMRRGEWDGAADQYLGLLQLNPRDSVAQAALISIHESLDPVAGESRIKLLLEREPEAAYLHFGLGNLYARERRWPQAQESFFHALRLDRENPDYAYNLAISLDRLGQRRTALSYYRAALDLAQRHYASFARDTAVNRIQALLTEGLEQ